MDVLTIGWRNVWRSRRRSLVTIAAMTLGLLTMILYAALMEGYLQAMERNVLDLEVGDLQVFADTYRDDPSIYTTLEDPEALLAPMDAAGFPASARLLAFGLVAADESSSAVSVRGVDVERDRRVSGVHRHVARGEWLDRADPEGVVIGRRLARTLAVDPGAEIVVLSQGADGAMATDLYRVRGILHGVSDATDRTGVFMTEAAFRELMVVPRGFHQIIVRRPADLPLPDAARAVTAMVPDADVRTWRQLLPTIASLLDSARAAMVVMYLLIYLAIAILILNAMLMAVFERIRELGVLKALGVGPPTVLALILVETVVQVSIAIAAGIVLSIPCLFYLVWVGIDLGSLAGASVLGIAMDPVWRAAVDSAVFAVPVATLVAVVALAVAYPAVKAAFIRPVEAMRHR